MCSNSYVDTTHSGESVGSSPEPLSQTLRGGGTTSLSAKKISIDCPVCGSKKFKGFLRATVSVTDPVKLYGAASGVRGTQDLVTCLNCELVYENPRYPEDVIIYGYSQSEEQGHDSQFEMRVGSFFRSLKGMQKYLPPKGAKVLDIGCAGGAFLLAAKKFGYDPYGIEPSAQLAESAQKKGLQVEVGTLETTQYPEKSFDIVCFWDVLEHVVDPKRTLEIAIKFLKPGGVLLVNYPDIGTPIAKIAGKKFWWILSVHLTHLSRKTLSILLNQLQTPAFKFIPYFQTLELGYLFSIADHLGVPLAGTINKLMPNFLKKIPILYYASQTTCLARPPQR